MELIKKYGNEVAAVIMEPIRNYPPSKEFISLVQEETRKAGAVLVVDEITAGWRLCKGGAHLTLGIEPDIAVFGKAISNGFPMGVIIGKSDIMDAAQDSFISSTYWTDRLGSVASLATIDAIQRYDIPTYLESAGKAVQEGWSRCAQESGLDIEVSGLYPLSHFKFLYEDSRLLETLFVKLMLEKGYLAKNAYYASYAHKDNIIDKYMEAVLEVFIMLKESMESNNLKDMLSTPLKHTGFERLT